MAHKYTKPTLEVDHPEASMEEQMVPVELNTEIIVAILISRVYEFQHFQ